MIENKYDDEKFFEQYSKMPRSIGGLTAAGEWHVLKSMLPEFLKKNVLDLGCGFGWHCRYAIECGAQSVIGIDVSKNMLDKAIEMTESTAVRYERKAVEDIDFDKDSFDIVISSLTLHYVKSFEDVCKKVANCLSKGGSFVFSVEHPIFTAFGNQDWFYNENGQKMHWPVDRYFVEGERAAVFLGEKVVKFHKTLTTYINTLLQCGFDIKEVVEPEPTIEMLKTVDGMEDELRRPMMLLISAVKK